MGYLLPRQQACAWARPERLLLCVLTGYSILRSGCQPETHSSRGSGSGRSCTCFCRGHCAASRATTHCTWACRCPRRRSIRRISGTRHAFPVRSSWLLSSTLRVACQRYLLFLLSRQLIPPTLITAGSFGRWSRQLACFDMTGRPRLNRTLYGSRQPHYCLKPAEAGARVRLSNPRKCGVGCGRSFNRESRTTLCYGHGFQCAFPGLDPGSRRTAYHTSSSSGAFAMTAPSSTISVHSPPLLTRSIQTWASSSRPGRTGSSRDRMTCPARSSRR